MMEEINVNPVQTPWLRRAKWLQRILAFVFSAIPVLLFLFYLAPSMTLFGVSGGNIYRLLSLKTGVGSCAIGLLILTCLAALVAVPLLLGEFNKYSHPLTPPFLIFATLMQTAILITAATLTGRIIAQDGGAGLLKVGAAPALSIAFSGLGVLLGGVYMGIFFHPNTDMDAIAPYEPLPMRPPRPQEVTRRIGYIAAGVLFGVVALGMLLFPIAPIMQTAGVKGESFYDLLKPGLPRVPVYTDCAIALVIFACLGVLAAATYFALIVKKKYRALSISSAIYTACALAQLLISLAVIVQVAKDDGGAKLLETGAAPILILVFSLPALLFGVFALVMFLFPIAPVMQMAGMKGQNFYDMLKPGLPHVPVYTDCAIALVIFACLGVLAAGLYATLLIKKKYRILSAASIPCAVCALVQTAISCVAIAQVRADDGGAGLLKAGAAPILILVFSLITLLGAAAVTAIPFVSKKPRPSVFPRWLGYATLGLFGVFALGMFLFPIAPIMQMAGMAGESFYDLLKPGLPRVPVYTDCAIALVIFACLGLLAAGLYVALFLKKKYHVLPAASIPCAVCAFVQTVISCVVIAQIAGSDGGAGMLKEGAAPILILVFSLITLLGAAAAAILPYVWKRPAGRSKSDKMQKEIEDLKQRVDELQNR